MAVVINEFEVVPGINRDADAPSPSSEGGDKVVLSSRDIEMLIAERVERDERVSAH